MGNNLGNLLVLTKKIRDISVFKYRTNSMDLKHLNSIDEILHVIFYMRNNKKFRGLTLSEKFNNNTFLFF